VLDWTTIIQPLWFHVPSITLKDIPRQLHRELKSRARANHRSLNKEAIATLQAATAPAVRADPETMMAQARAARSQFRRAVSAKEIANWKNKGRL
jgi:plasmid stability protein